MSDGRPGVQTSALCHQRHFDGARRRSYFWRSRTVAADTPLIMRNLPLAPVATAIITLIACQREPRKSQPAMLVQRFGETTITVRYNRPSARGRALFGGLVPYGQTWDPGADEATTFATDHDIVFGGQPLRAGAYSVWAIPDTTAWTIILSSAYHVFHIPYPAGHDVLRLRVPPTTGPFEETLAFEFPVAEADHGLLALHWGTTVITIPIAMK
jgi:Protein of unknown function (DUF2911)